MKFTTYTLFILFSVLVVVSAFTFVGCDRPGMKYANIVYDMGGEVSAGVINAVESALDSKALENTVKLFYMWDNEFCDKDESEMQRLNHFLLQYPELDTAGLNRFEFDTIEAAEIFCEVVEGYYKLRKADLPYVDGKYVAQFQPSHYPMHW